MCFGDTKTCHQVIVGSRLWSVVTAFDFLSFFVLRAQRASCLFY